MEVDALGRVLVKPTESRRRRLQGLAGVMGELAEVIGEEGRAVEGRISKDDAGRRTLGGHRRWRSTPWAVFS